MKQSPSSPGLPPSNQRSLREPINPVVPSASGPNNPHHPQSHTHPESDTHPESHIKGRFRFTNYLDVQVLGQAGEIAQAPMVETRM
jgi:hypothetical protein